MLVVATFARAVGLVAVARPKPFEHRSRGELHFVTRERESRNGGAHPEPVARGVP